MEHAANVKTANKSRMRNRIFFILIPPDIELIHYVFARTKLFPAFHLPIYPRITTFGAALLFLPQKQTAGRDRKLGADINRSRLRTATAKKWQFAGKESAGRNKPPGRPKKARSP